MEKNSYLYNEFLSRLQKFFVFNFLVSGLFILLFIIYSTSIVGQTVIIGKYPQKIPEGKKWVLPLNKSLLIEVNEGVLNIGTLCSAKFLTKTPSISALIEGDFGRPNMAYVINFKNLSRVPYTNGVTFSIVPTSFSSYDYLKSQQSVIQSIQSITFYQGQTVYITQCLESLQLIEYNLTANDISELKQKEKNKKELEIKSKREQEVNRIKEQEEAFSANIINKAPFRLDELNNKPFLIRIDNLNLKEEILNLPSNRNNTYFDIKVDTTGKMIGILVDFIETGEQRQADSIAFKFRTTNYINERDSSILKFFTSHFKVSESGIATLRNKKIKENFILPIQLVYNEGKISLSFSYNYIDETQEYSFDYKY